MDTTTRLAAIECCESTVRGWIKTYTTGIRNGPRCGFFPGEGQCPALLTIADHLDKLLDCAFGSFSELIIAKQENKAADEKWGEGMGALMEGDAVHMKQFEEDADERTAKED